MMGNIVVHPNSQHSITWWAILLCIPPTTLYHMVVRTSCIPPANTVPQCGQIIVHSTNKHSTTWWSDHRAFHQPTQWHMVVRTLCIPPTNTVPHGGQIIVHSTSQHTWWSDHCAFHQPTQYQLVHSTNQHSTTWWSDHGAFHHPTQYHMLVRSPCIPPTITVPHGCQIIVHSTNQRIPHGGQIEACDERGGA